MTIVNFEPILKDTAACLVGFEEACRGLLEILHSIKVEDLVCPVAQIPSHHDLLDVAISCIDDQSFGRLGNTLIDIKDHLHWKVDDGGYYPHGVDVGAGYQNGNMHALLVGPKNAVVQSDDYLLGFFLLAPHTLYRDHKHLAPELYVPLTGPSGWRFGLGPWHDFEAGQQIFNAPEVVHATRVYDTPFLSLFAWTNDIHAQCAVVPADDWDDIELSLAQNTRIP